MHNIRRAIKWLLVALLRLIWWVISLPFRFLGWLFRPVVDKFKQGSIYRFMTEVPDDRPTVDAIADAFQDPMQILDQLEDVRKHLLRALVVTAVMIGLAAYYTNGLIAMLAAPVGGMHQLFATGVTDNIGAFMIVALVAGIALATPYIVFEIWWFIAPGLMPRSRQWGLAAIPLALIFFLGGVAFAYYVMLPVALVFLRDFLDVQQIWTVMGYISFIASLLFWVGVAFEFPLVVFALSAMGFVEPGVLLKQWRIAIVLISILAAVITPTVDPVNMSLVMGPMIALYFLSILFSYIARALNNQPE
jgi:sec-independent protein translocase protein TatC